MRLFDCARAAYVLASALVVFAVVGCHVPAQIAWAPDGTRAAYCIQGAAFVIDEHGRIVDELDDFTAGFAWSADSQTLYLAAAAGGDHSGAERAAPPARKSRAQTPHAASRPTTAPALPSTFALRAYARGGSARTLATFEAATVSRVALSPDQRWIAIVASIDDDQRERTYTTIYLYDTSSQRVTRIAPRAAAAVCFTGPARLAFVEPLDERATIGRLVELDLSTGAGSTPAPHYHSLELPMYATWWMQPIGNDDIFFTAQPQCVPSASNRDRGEPRKIDLYHWSRADGKVRRVVADVGELFMPNPDGSLVLFERRGRGARRWMSILRTPAHSKPHDLRDMRSFRQLPMFPAWLGNDQITFISKKKKRIAATEDMPARDVYDVVLYELTPRQKLQPIRMLSENWDERIKPCIMHEPGVSFEKRARRSRTINEQ